ncbi:MAG: putative sulfate exporter family transporter [Deltaproteobacteria bacterium]|nr:putative sulfate exporter family transporter [Deltaproteobacteria bacterium]MBW2307751.1 putative sulfate exporter family transporter [Deltaproteobacteria bacterium]
MARKKASASIDMSPQKIPLLSLLPSFHESWPGLLALIVIAVFCQLPGVPWPITIHHLLKYIDAVLPPIYGKGLFTDLLHFNYVVIGLAIGILIRNVIGVPKRWETGLTYTSVFLHAAIIMLGSQYLLRDMLKIGGETIIIMVVFVFGSAIVVISLGRLFKVEQSLTGVLAAGFSMCGVAATVATAPMVRAKSEEVTYAIAATVSFGLFCLIGLPLVARLLEMSQYSFGVLSATGVPNSAQVIATGFMYGFEAGKVSGFVNIGRVVLIPAGALFICFFVLTREVMGTDIKVWQVIKEKFPIYVFGFIVVWAANCLHLFPKPAVYAMEQVMIWFFTLSFVGLGLQTKLGDVKKAGIKGMIVGYTAGILKLGLCLVVILILIRMGIFE